MARHTMLNMGLHEVDMVRDMVVIWIGSLSLLSAGLLGPNAPLNHEHRFALIEALEVHGFLIGGCLSLIQDIVLVHSAMGGRDKDAA